MPSDHFLYLLVDKLRSTLERREIGGINTLQWGNDVKLIFDLVRAEQFFPQEEKKPPFFLDPISANSMKKVAILESFMELYFWLLVYNAILFTAVVVILPFRAGERWQKHAAISPDSSYSRRIKNSGLQFEFNFRGIGSWQHNGVRYLGMKMSCCCIRIA